MAAGVERRGGLIVQAEGEARFLPGSVAVRVVAVPPITPVPGSVPDLLGIAVHEGLVLPVIAVGARRDAMVVCQHAGELVGLVGLRVLEAGAFEPEGDGVRSPAGERVELLDVAAVYARVRHHAARTPADG